MITFTKVKLPYGWLSNMSPHPVVHGGQTWRTTEHLFQALRFEEGSIVRASIRRCSSPMSAKMEAKKFSSLLPAGYEAGDADRMRLCLYLKVQQHPDLREQLLATGDEEIVEDVSNRARGTALRWGKARDEDDPSGWTGENLLGKLWMELRGTLRRTG